MKQHSRHIYILLALLLPVLCCCENLPDPDLGKADDNRDICIALSIQNDPLTKSGVINTGMNLKNEWCYGDIVELVRGEDVYPFELEASAAHPAGEPIGSATAIFKYVGSVDIENSDHFTGTVRWAVSHYDDETLVENILGKSKCSV